MLLENVVQATKQLKQDICNDQNGPADIQAVMKIDFPNESPLIVPVVGKKEPMENLKDALSLVLAFRKDNHQSYEFESIVFVTEGFMTVCQEIPVEYQKGQLQEEYATNPASDVVQCVLIHLFNWDCSSEMAILKYYYNDYGKPVFEQEEILGQKAAGNVITILQSFRAFCKFSQEAA